MSEWDAIVLDLNGEAEMLRACVESLFAQSHPPTRIILFDNGSTTPTAARVTSLPKSVVHVRSESNRGFAAGVNAALESTRAEFIALVNNDAVVGSQWAATLLGVFGDATVAATQSVVLTMDGAAVDGAGIALRAGRIEQLAHRCAPDAVNSRAFWGVSATAAIYRRSAIEQVSDEPGMFDERFVTYYEDVELAARFDDAGLGMVLVEEPLARHRGSASASFIGGRGEVLRTRNRYFVARLHPQVARRVALLLEDARRVGASIVRGNLGAAATIVRGVVAGLTTRLQR